MKVTVRPGPVSLMVNMKRKSDIAYPSAPLINIKIRIGKEIENIAFEPNIMIEHINIRIVAGIILIMVPKIG